MVDVLFDDRWLGAHGIGRFAQKICARLPGMRRLGTTGRRLSFIDPFRLHRLLRRQRPRAYFTPGFNPPWRSPVPYVFCLHDLIHLDDPRESSIAKRAYYHTIVRPAGHRACRVITVSEYSRRRILEWSGWPEQRVIVAPNGVDHPFTPDGPRHEPGYAYLLYVGAHRPHKNVSGLLDAFARSGVAPTTKLEMTGTPTARERAQIERLNLHDAVVAFGQVDDDKLARRYRGALALVCPSWCEGFGLPALEAMACGTAVIAANTGALPEVIGSSGLLVNPHEVDQIAAAIGRLVADPSERRRLEAAGQQRAAHFTWERTANVIAQALADVSGIDPESLRSP